MSYEVQGHMKVKLIWRSRSHKIKVGLTQYR